jgi:uracil-DNA glycosylase
VSTQYPIMILGEAWGAEEAQIGLPFVGSSGRLLNDLLSEAEIERSSCYVTNVFNLQPQPTNDIKNLCTDRKNSSVPMPELFKGAYLQDQYWPEVLRLRSEIENIRPNLIIALGNTAMWALTGVNGIRSLRGTVTASTYPGGFKILPTYHPAAVLRDWSLRPVVVADLMKAKRQSLFPEIRRPKRELWLEPSLNHIELFYLSYVQKCTKLSWDIETAGADQITCVGFAPSPERAIVIPFVDNRSPSGSYWPDTRTEVLAWKAVAKYLAHPASTKVTQNGLYDMHWLWAKIGIRPYGPDFEDTMLMHHAMNPELEKGLGFLGSVYTDEPAWKTMRGKGMFTIKKGE